MRKKTIGLIAQTSIDSYQTELLAGAIDAARKYDFNLVRFTQENAYFASRYANQVELFSEIIKKERFDGLMFVAWIDEIFSNIEKFISHIQMYKPLSLLSIGKTLDGIPSVSMRGDTHILELLKHLFYDHGYRNIVFISPIQPDDRYGVYEQFMKDQGVFDPGLVVSETDIPNWADWAFNKRVSEVVSLLFDARKLEIDAIMSMYTYEADIVIRELEKRGYRVPHDVAVTSWEDGERGRFGIPSITSVYYPYYQLAYQGATSLYKHLNGEPIPMVTNISGEIRIRRSCGCTTQKINAITVGQNLDPGKIPAGTAPAAAVNLDMKKIVSRLKNRIQILDIDDMINAFVRDLDQESENAFINLVDEYIYSKKTNVDDLYQVQREIFIFRSGIVPYFRYDASELIKAENIFKRLQVVISEYIESISSYSEVLRSSTQHMIQGIGQEIVTTMDMDKLLNILTRGLKRIGIPSAYIFIFPEGHECPLNDTLIYAFRDNRRVYDFEHWNTPDNTSKFKYIFREKQSSFILNLLHISNHRIGYILFEPGPNDERIYYSLSVELSSAIYGAYTLDNLKMANTRLQVAQKEIMNNIEVIKQKSYAIEKSNKKLSELDTLKNDFIANLTHDFRSPLMVILNSIELGMRFDKSNDPRATAKRFVMIKSASMKLKSAIDRLLDLAKMDAQGVRINIKKIDIKVYLKSIIHFYISATQATNIEISCNLPERPIEDIYTDIDKLEEIMHNIISNALKFIDPENGKVEISLAEKESFIEIAVKDNGIGIPPNKLNIVFSRFEQIGDNRDRAHKGTGIGLAFAKQLVEYLKGTIRAESDGPGKGACFIIELPKGKKPYLELIGDTQTDDGHSKPDEEKRRHIMQVLEIDIAEHLNKEKVTFLIDEKNNDNEYNQKKALFLIIDDSKDIRSVLHEILNKAGYKNFILATDGKTGLDIIYEYKPDFIICDSSMPEMKGDVLHDQLVINPELSRIPVVFLTAVGDQTLKLERKQKGACAYLQIPIDENDLLATIDIHLKKYLEMKRLIHQVSVDELTGLSNKNHIVKFLRDRVMLRYFQNLSVIFMDMDHFRYINDTYGYQVGDSALAEVGQVIQSVIRSYDKAGRYGGEEFIIVLPDTQLKAAFIVAEKIRKQVATIKIRINEEVINVTASFGIASMVDHEQYIAKQLGVENLGEIYNITDKANVNWESVEHKKKSIVELLINMADQAMYQAKSSRCKDCNHVSAFSDKLRSNFCPECDSSNIDHGRNKVAEFIDI